MTIIPRPIRRSALAALSLVALLLPGVAAAGPRSVPPAGPDEFLETFDGKPEHPTPWNARDWDVFQTTRDPVAWENPDPVDAHHAFHNCGDVADGGSHQVTTWDETVFQCNDHIMTSINGTPGYGAIYLSPPAMADFTDGPSTVSFDVSTFVSSTRDWLDVLVTPFEDAMSYPFRSDLDVDGSGLPQNAIHIEQDFGSTQWKLEVIRDGTVEPLGTLAIPYDAIGGASRVTRTPVSIEISSTSITMSYPTADPAAAVTVGFAALDWTTGIVQFGHHSYNPMKDCEATPELSCEAGTWHWDNIRISPAQPFYQWQATPERTGAPVYDSDPRILDLGRPAPANAELVFSAACGVEVSFPPDDTWQPTTIIANTHVEHTQSYRVEVPEGTTEVAFRFVDNDWYAVGLGCHLANPIVKALEPAGA